ncbi:MAG TPA: DUF1631 family protein [Gammaproteobacteria bacterium]|nr:DUF1631 family protein [Gammaproteobacteria bacterium]
MNVINTGNREGARRESHRDSPVGQTPAQTSAQKHHGLLEAVRAQCANHVQSSLRTLFDKADDLLFDLARRSEDYHVKREYFEAMQAIHRQRGQMEDHCKSEFLSAFDQCRLHPSPAAVSPTQVKSDSIDDDITRGQLAIAFLIENAERGAREELHALNQRVGILLGRPGLPARDNPAGPATVGVTVKTVMSQVCASGFIRLLLFALFDRHVMGRLQTLYRILNEFLIDHQILPEIPMPVQKPEAAANAAAGDLPSAVFDLSVIAAGSSRIESSWLLTGASTPLPPAAVNTKLVEALTSLQRGVYPTPEAKVGRVAFNVVRDIKIRGFLPRMDQADDAKFDLVAMLFDYFLNDEQLPVALRERIACLQIPFLKTAFIDSNFFILKTHPARQLLNTITRAGLESMGTPALLEALLGLIDRTVQRVRDEFAEDIALFATLRMQLEQDIAAVRRESSAAGPCTIHAPPDQPRHEDAKRKIRALIDSRLDHPSQSTPAIHESVRSFILTHWQHLLIQHFLLGGENGALLNDAIHTMDDLIWSTALKHDATERARLRQLQPDLIRRLETGMGEIALPPFARSRFLEKLAKCHAKAVGLEAGENRSSGTISEDVSLAIAAAMLEDSPQSAGKKPDPEEITTPREVYLKTVRAVVSADAAVFGAVESDPKDRRV